MKLNRTIICSKLVNGCTIYESARKSYSKILDIVHHEVIRLTLGVFSTSSINSLCVEANEPPFKLRRVKLAIQYYQTKILSFQSKI